MWPLIQALKNPICVPPTSWIQSSNGSQRHQASKWEVGGFVLTHNSLKHKSGTACWGYVSLSSLRCKLACESRNKITQWRPSQKYTGSKGSSTPTSLSQSKGLKRNWGSLQNYCGLMESLVIEAWPVEVLAIMDVCWI